MSHKFLIGSIITAVGTLVTGGTYVYKNFIFDKDGYNKQGYNKSGFDRDGYDKEGYDHQGFNRDGFDREGYDKYGYNKDGFDKSGIDREGYNKRGFKDGYDRSGKDSDGYHKSGYNDEGIDRGGMTVDFYNNKAHEIEKLLNKAHFQMKREEFEYALRDIRVGLEKVVKCVITHWKGSYFIKKELDENIKVCKDYKLLPTEFVDELFSAKNHCNSQLHDSNVQKEYGQVHFTYKVLEELKGRIIFSNDN